MVENRPNHQIMDFLTLSNTLQERLVVADPQTVKEVWDHIEKNFLDNKRTKSIALKVVLRMNKLSDLTVDTYYMI